MTLQNLLGLSGGRKLADWPDLVFSVLARTGIVLLENLSYPAENLTNMIGSSGRLGMRGLVIALALLAAQPHLGDAAEVLGVATVVDGDTLHIGDVMIRLHGIDAPESRQTCDRDGVSWLCGAEASDKLRQLVRGQEVACYETDRDQYRRMVAVCRVGDVELGAAMVLSGLALAYRRYGQEYVLHESVAKEAKRGLWAGDFVPPWDWRSGERDAPPAEQARDDCRIKGNINRRGDRIYHLPGQPSYEGTVIDESRGERWFCTEEQAQAAGWRPPR